MLPVDTGLTSRLFWRMSSRRPAWLAVHVRNRLERRIGRHIPEQIGRADHLAADQAKRRALGVSADRARYADAGCEVQAAANHRLLGLGAARGEQDLKLQAVSLEDAGALAEFGDARIPQATLWNRDADLFLAERRCADGGTDKGCEREH